MSRVLDSKSRPVVLLIDDVPQNLSLLSGILKNEYAVKVANSGEAGLRLAFSDEPPDLILLDVMMSGMDGHEVCRQLKADERSRHIPVIFLTACEETDDERRGFELGAVDYITKPISPPILLARVRTQIELKAAADRLYDLNRFVSDSLDSLPDPTLVCDLAGKVLIANKAAARHFQDCDVLDADVAELMREVRSTTSQQPILPDIGRENASFSLTREGEDPQGRQLLVRCVPSFAASDRHSGWILSITDLTEMREAERQRDQALRFLTHDLREPQSSILTLLELYRRGPRDILPEELLLRIERHAQRALHLTDSYVQAARAESMDYQFAPCDLNGLLDEAADDAWAGSRERDVEVLVSSELPQASCVVDRQMVLRAVGNLLSNALKFSAKGSKVYCSLGADAACWRISVQDQGPGIEAAKQARLFQPYNRLHEDSHPEAGGVGLGLAFVSAVAKRHGGSVELDSEVGRGCTFRLLLPREALQESA
ncbi:response regulator [Burkholderiaceae bacterium UC74_6]